MFPSFRVVSDGPFSGLTTFLSNEALYTSRSLESQPPYVPVPDTRSLQNMRSPEVPLPESLDEEIVEEPV